MTHGNQPGDMGGHGHPPGGGYGHPPPPGSYGYQPPPGPGTAGTAVASLVLGVLGLVLCGVPGILGVIFGHIALNQTQRTGQQGRGLAIAGLVLSYGGIAIWILYAVLLGMLATLGMSANGY